MDAGPALADDLALVAQGFAGPFDAGFLGRDEGQPVAAHDRPRLRDEAVPDSHVPPDPHTGMQQNVLADLGPFGDGHVRGNARVGPMRTWGPITASGPMAAPGATCALGSMIALG